MSSRREQKDRLREERLAAEEAEAREAARRRWFQAGAAGIFIAVVAIVTIVILSSGGGTSSPAATGTGAAIPAAAQQGLQSTPAPWNPEYSHLTQRVQAMHLPSPSDSAFHHHAMLHVFVNGQPVPVPGQIGIDAASGFLSPLHTHDPSGIIHIESARPFPFTLGEFITVWGVKFTNDQLGSYKVGGGNQLKAYVNGRPVSDPTRYVMQQHDSIVLGFGKPGSFPTSVPGQFPPGL